ncbi:uncharacterized protein Z518_07979 [Rhinocladiella mackenziei CBS 650.93]|uniref:Rhinocladiella mackenziei CBS 650.93 unplaced genomic scaffold supercont1.6, whole genome shotgun sequence n=1 Tax=Rhinocladiella mackenziei CBS 650.93 TaxID=1442369 RepID=A0A0D2IZK1_9EURO|nr:uncharacterized protein Z518_07979 [Rhinocladiella mackenziei CBS 650.93]KIX02040.1 hypothetical protein Z518_07979 [Rhinocladiella mackenziei CBS 650.93]
MELQRMRRTAASGTNGLIELPEYIITTFFPGARPLLEKHPQLFRFLGVLLALWYFGPITRLQSLWNRFSSVLVATINVSSEEDLFSYVTSYIAERKTLRADQSLNATSNPPQESRRRHRHDPEVEESGRRSNEDPKIKYEQGQGMQIFVHKKRLFYITRKYGDGHTYLGNRYKRIEIISLSCLGRSTAPIKELIEHIYYLNKDKERSLTIIRRPYTGGYGSRLTWSRLTSKPRRALDTVILDADQKEQVLADVAEYMDEATMNFYANHGIPYRRGYLFHGPPGVGKTSFALALASKFNLDVYNLTLLDHDLTDSDLISLLNQLPGRSLLLLEDIDTAGLNRKGKSTTARKSGPRRGMKMPLGIGGGNKATSVDDDDVDSDEETGTSTTSRVTLSGLLNAIDGVAAPEGHVLIMTTNKPYELDDALVRAGRISVRVGFKNASKAQAEEIFLRMYVDFPSTNGPFDEKASVDPKRNEHPSTTAENTAHLRELASKFASLIPDHDFSPADLQDYLLIHKKDAKKAVEGLSKWMEETYEERRRKEEEKEAERELKREARRNERRRFREEIKAAVKETEEAEVEEESSEKFEKGTNTNEGKNDEESIGKRTEGDEKSA